MRAQSCLPLASYALVVSSKLAQALSQDSCPDQFYKKHCKEPHLMIC
ncbi:hypothetical protein Tco_0701087, partial [Tanacetum coccineum]